jgi:hypothetical protein
LFPLSVVPDGRDQWKGKGKELHSEEQLESWSLSAWPFPCDVINHDWEDSTSKQSATKKGTEAEIRTTLAHFLSLKSFTKSFNPTAHL